MKEPPKMSDLRNLSDKIPGLFLFIFRFYYFFFTLWLSLKFLLQEYFIPADIKGVFTSYRFETRQVDTVWTRLEPNPNTQLEWELMFAMGRVEIRFVTEWYKNFRCYHGTGIVLTGTGVLIIYEIGKLTFYL